jgi:carboxyl-terminal processing protease
MRHKFFSIIIWLLLPLIISWQWTAPAWALTEEQKLLNEAWRIVNLSYVDDSFNHQNWWALREKWIKKPLATRADTYNEIEKMLATLDDPFTRLLRPDQYHSLRVTTSGELTGVGLQIGINADNDRLTVISPIAGSPAEAAGIQPGDRILQIDGVETKTLSLDEAANRMRGATGTTVMLTIEQATNNQVKDIKLTRNKIAINAVSYQVGKTQDNRPIGYIRLNQFSANATQEVRLAIRALEKQSVVGYVLDLRNNPGGLLQSGVDIANLWLDGGTIVYTVNRQGVLDSFESVGDAITDKPLTLLVNQGTASASEILAGALQDNGRAVLIGEKTFGKGLIQSLFDLSDGAGLAVTVAKYETPNHHDINKLGIMPDQVVSLGAIKREQVATKDDPQYQAAVNILENKLVVAHAS